MAAAAGPGGQPDGRQRRYHRIKTTRRTYCFPKEDVYRVYVDGQVVEQAEPPSVRYYIRNHLPGRHRGVWFHRSSRTGQRIAKSRAQASARARANPAFRVSRERANQQRHEEKLKRAEEAAQAAETQSPVEPAPAGPDAPVWAPKTDAELLEAVRQKALHDLYFFAHTVCELGHNPNPKGPRVTDDQRELCAFMQAEAEAPSKRIRAIFMPRGTLKTTILEAYVLWRLVKDPNYRILLYGEVHQQAQARMARIKRIITDCATFRRVFGDLDGSKKGLPWNENVMTVGTREGGAVREGSIETAGLDVTVNARHFDEIIADDIESENNTKTKKAIEGIVEKIQLLIPLADQGATLTFIGTFWSDADAYVWLLDTQAQHVAEFRRSIYREDGVTPRFPNVLPQDEIDFRRSMLRKDIFACQYLLDPVPREDAIFKEEYFTRLPRAAIPDGTRYYILVDQAGDPTADQEQKRDSDYTGMVVWGVTPNQDLILMDVFRGRVNPTEAVEQLLVLYYRHRPKIIGIEKAGVGNLGFFVREALRRDGEFPLVEDVAPKGRSKYQRVMELEPLARRRKIYFCESAQATDVFVDEATRFPKAKHDDVIDAAAYIMDLLVLHGTPADPGTGDPILPRLVGLSETSKNYWYAHHKAQDKKAQEGRVWAREFV